MGAQTTRAATAGPVLRPRGPGPGPEPAPPSLAPSPPRPPTSFWRRARGWTIGLGLLLTVALTLAVLIAAALVQEAPSWWRTVRRDDPATVETARTIENSVWNQLYHPRAGDEDDGVWRSDDWTVSLKAADANAWLNARLPKWLVNQHEEADWPDELTEVQVDFADGRIHLGARVNDGATDRVFSATLVPALADDGSLWVTASRVSLGRLALPADWILPRAERHRAEFIPDEFRDLPETLHMFRAFAGGVPMFRDAAIRLEDGRRVRLLALRPVAGRLEITCRTERDRRE